MAGNGDDLFFFQGTLGQLTVTLINPYSSESIFVDEEKNINNSTYDGLGGTDTILFTNFGDAIFITNNLNQQVVKNVEIFFAGDGGDVIHMAHGSITTGDITIFGGQGDDILWSNVGNDTIFGAGGHDTIDGGPGSDQLYGEDDNDRISGGSGNDTVDGGTGNDTLLGGDGADMYYAGEGNDQITDAADGDTDVIYLPSGITLANITFTNVGDDLHMTVDSVGSIVIHGQFDSASSGIDTLIFSNNTTFDLRTLPHNDEPVAHDDDFIVNEDNVLNGNVLADNGQGADHDDDNDTLTVTAGIFATAHGSVVLAADGSFTYTPVADYHGTDSFTYTLLDGQGGTDTGTVHLVVAAVNDDPVAQDDDFTGYEDTPLLGNVLAHNGHGVDSDIDGGTLSVVAATIATAHGTVSLLADGSFTYTAIAGYFGADSFDYTLLDGQGGSDIGHVNILIQSNDITGTGGNDTLSGTNNADNMLGLGGNDVLNGNGGNDVLNGGMGADLMNGGMGDDAFIYNTDATWTGGFVAWNVGSVSVAGTDIRVPITGMNRSYDQFNGGDGVDTIIMGSGNDAIFLHDDYSLRPDGTVDGRITGVEVFYAGDGDDVLDLTSWLWDDADNVTMHGGNGNDNLWSSTGNDYLYGEDGNDYLYGGGGNDYLDGGDGNDKLYGSVDHDIMLGGDGNDCFYGEAGNDILFVGEGLDKIHGGAGSDQIVYDFMDSNTDIIHDFQAGSGGDVLNITDILEGYDPMTDLLSDFVQVTQQGNNTLVKINADGDSGGSFTAIAKLLDVNTTLAAMVSGGNLVADHSVVV